MAVKPKLALIPSGVKASKVYSVLPSDGVGDFDFSRSGSATRINKDGLIETVASNVPRLNYPLIDGVVSGCPSLLLEPQSINRVTHSEDFSDASWTKTRSSVVSNVEISPKGNLTASRLFDDTSSNSHYIRTVLTSTTSDNSRFIFAKKGTFNYIQVSEIEQRGISNGYAIFDLENGVVIQSVTFTAEIEDFGNGWYKCILKGSSYNIFDINILNSASTGSSGQIYTGTGTDYISIWGAMLEENYFSTSYIPTNGSQATRSAETCNNAGDVNTFNDSEGVLMAEIAYPNPTTSSNLRIAISDGTGSNRILIQNVSFAPNRLQFYVIANGVVSTDFLTDLSDITSFNKIAFKYKTNDFSVWINGFEVLTDTIGSTFSDGTLNEFAFDGGDGAFDFYGNTKQIKYFNKALSDAELAALTKI